MSRLGDLLVEIGPYPSPRTRELVFTADELNALRDELIALRAAEAERREVLRAWRGEIRPDLVAALFDVVGEMDVRDRAVVCGWCGKTHWGVDSTTRCAQCIAGVVRPNNLPATATAPHPRAVARG